MLQATPDTNLSWFCFVFSLVQENNSTEKSREAQETVVVKRKRLISTNANVSFFFTNSESIIFVVIERFSIARRKN